MEWKPARFDKISVKVLYEDAEKGEMTCLLKLEPGLTCRSTSIPNWSRASCWRVRSGGRPRRDKGGCFFGCEHDGTKSTRSGLLGERPNLRGRRDDHLPLAVHVDESQTPGHRLRTPGQ